MSSISRPQTRRRLVTLAAGLLIGMATGCQGTATQMGSANRNNNVAQGAARGAQQSRTYADQQTCPEGASSRVAAGKAAEDASVAAANARAALDGAQQSAAALARARDLRTRFGDLRNAFEDARARLAQHWPEAAEGEQIEMGHGPATPSVVAAIADLAAAAGNLAHLMSQVAESPLATLSGPASADVSLLRQVHGSDFFTARGMPEPDASAAAGLPSRQALRVSAASWQQVANALGAARDELARSTGEPTRVFVPGSVIRGEAAGGMSPEQFAGVLGQMQTVAQDSVNVDTAMVAHHAQQAVDAADRAKNAATAAAIACGVGQYEVAEWSRGTGWQGTAYEVSSP